jgi:hypothetical protein
VPVVRVAAKVVAKVAAMEVVMGVVGEGSRHSEDGRHRVEAAESSSW